MVWDQKAYEKKYNQTPHRKAWRHNYYLSHPEMYKVVRESSKQKAQARRLLILQHYSKSIIPFCACCGEKTIEFLTIDHIAGKGNEHRREIGKGVSFQIWLVKQRLPEDYQILCYNCNLSKGAYKMCPHERLRQQIQEGQRIAIVLENRLQGN